MMPPSAGSTSLDEVFEALSDPYRRRILLALAAHDPHDGDAVTVEAVAADDDDLAALRTVLYHSHLPKLAASGYIEREPDTGAIRRGPNFEAVEPLLDLVVERDDALPADLRTGE